MGKDLVIVESPAKASTIKKYLSNEYVVKASVGHVKDLPKEKLGVDIENNFAPDYIVIKGKAKIIKDLKECAKKANKIYLAPDPDREGEAIAWHVANTVVGKNHNDRVCRVMFNEITKRSVIEAIKNPVKIDVNKVNAQQTRRILDRLVGYKISPLLWQKVGRGLSAGRVQSVALYLICDREREVNAFVPQEYWSITACLEGKAPPQFDAKLFKVKNKKIEISNKEESDSILNSIKGASFIIHDVQKKERKKNPAPPFITSTLQQEASRRYRYSAKKTMMIAQRLYEGLEIGSEGPVGLITYMRTDSTRIAREALGEVRGYIKERFGTDYIPDRPNIFKSKKTAQEAHEAIRPTSMKYAPNIIQKYLGKEESAIYDLIWNRFMASQMSQAILDITTFDIKASDCIFRANGAVVRFPGFTRAYNEATDEKNKNKTSDNDNVLPPLTKGESLKLLKIVPKQHFTQPPPRYTEATLIRELEDKGIGRPSTYATIMSTILNRKYVSISERRLFPSKLGILITDLLTASFPDILNVEFTAKMEEELDMIEEGRKDWVGSLKDFYKPFNDDLKKAEVEMKNVKATVEETSEKCEKCGSTMVIRWGRFGHFLACSNYPECKNTKEISEKGGKIEIEEPEKTDEKCKKCGSAMVIKHGKFGRFLACSSYPECRNTKPVGCGVKCPEEGCEGEIVEKRSKKGKLFYGCSLFPKCKFASWNKPLNNNCPECGSYLVEKSGRGDAFSIRCSKDKCGYKAQESQLISGS